MNASLAEKYELAQTPFGQAKSSYPGLDAIADLVPADEIVALVVRGTLVGKGRGNTWAQGTDMGAFATLVLTDKCLHMFGKIGFTSKVKRSEVYNFENNTGVSRMKKALQGWAIEISRASNVDYFVNMVEGDSEQLYNQLRELVSKSQKSSGGGTTVINQIDPMDQLKKLKDLLDAGILSQEEFEEKKKALLDKI